MSVEGSAYIFKRSVISEEMSSGNAPVIPEGGLSLTERNGTGRPIHEQISKNVSSRSDCSGGHRLGLLDAAKFIWLGIRIPPWRFHEPGLCRRLPTRRRPFLQLLETVPFQARCLAWSSTSLPLSKMLVLQWLAACRSGTLIARLRSSILTTGGIRYGLAPRRR